MDTRGHPELNCYGNKEFLMNIYPRNIFILNNATR